MNIVSDFDGVLTDLTAEGLRCQELFRTEWIRLLGDEKAVDRWIVRAEEAMTKSTKDHGWWEQGRISAYCDEDLFIRNKGMASCLSAWAAQGEGDLDLSIQALRRAGVENFEKLADWAFRTMAAETHAGDIRPLDPVAIRTLSGLAAEGHSVVIVSNSATDRILNIIRDSGVDVRDHAKDPKAPFRVRGGARKFELSAQERRPTVLNGRSVDLARPAYLELLNEEKPDVVIGDVYSFDLALPEARGEGRTRVLLRERGYTPQWSRELFAPGASPVRSLLRDFTELRATLRL